MTATHKDIVLNLLDENILSSLVRIFDLPNNSVHRTTGEEGSAKITLKPAIITKPELEKLKKTVNLFLIKKHMTCGDITVEQTKSCIAMHIKDAHTVEDLVDVIEATSKKQQIFKYS